MSTLSIKIYDDDVDTYRLTKKDWTNSELCVGYIAHLRLRQKTDENK